MKDTRNNHNVCNIYYHITFCPKFRHSILNEDVSNYLKEIFITIGNEYSISVLEQEVMVDHVHLFVSAPPRISPSEIVKILKSKSAIELLKKYPDFKKTHSWKKGFWSPSFYLETVGSVSKEAILFYIQNQKKKL